VLAVLALRVPMLKEESPVDQPPDRTVPRGDAPPVAASRSALDLPSPAEVRFRTASGEMRYTILAIAAEPAPGGRERLELLVRLVNRGDAGANFWDDSFALLADGTRYEPVSRLNEVVPSFATQEGRLEFIVPAGLDAAALEISLGENETTSIPLRLEARAPLVATSETDEFGRRRPVRVVDAIALPVALQAGQRVRAGRVTFELTSATFERDTTERAALVLVVRCSVPPEGSPVNYWSRSVRLVVDGAPIAPVNAINEIVGPGESKDATFVFGLEALPASLALEFRDGGAMASLPLDLPTR
jgi:hypothetical protein